MRCFWQLCITTLLTCVFGLRSSFRDSKYGSAAASTVQTVLQEPLGVHIAKDTVLSLAEAEMAFMSWRAQFDPQPCPACTAREAASEDKSSFLETVAERRGAVNRSSGSPTRLTKALFAAMTPEPALAACMTMNVNLLAMGIPASLTLSFRGEVAYGVCNRCFEWRLESDMAYKVGFDALGYEFQVGFFVNGGVKLRELPCTDAPESDYCRFLHIFLPPEIKKLTSSSKRCHSESPFEALIAFIDFQWRKLRATAKGEKEVFMNDFHRKLFTYAQQLKAYPSLFASVAQGFALSKPAGRSTSQGTSRKQSRSRSLSKSRRSRSAGALTQLLGAVHNGAAHGAHASQPVRRALDDRILLVTCVRGEELPSRDIASDNDAYCQIEVSLAGATTDENYQRVYGGVGPREESECTSRLPQVCKNLDRCFWKPSLKKGRLCTLAPKFMGEVWRSSYISDTAVPKWHEGHGFRLPKGPNDVILYGAIFDWDEDGNVDTVGAGLNRSITVPAGDQPVSVKLPLQHNGDRAGFLFVTLQWLEPEGGGPPAGKLADPLGAMAAAVEGFVGKLPDYAAQVGTRLEDTSKRWEVGINYKSLSGRYMARWLRAEVREDLEEKEFADVDAVEYVKDSNAPKDKSGCRYQSSSRQCEPALYCQKSPGLFSFVQKCELREFVVLPCKTQLQDLFCCDVGDGDNCTGSTRTPCRIDKKRKRRGLMGHMQCTNFQCMCQSGLCYDDARKACSNPQGNCSLGTRDQQKKCHEAAVRSQLGGRYSKGSSKVSSGSRMLNYLRHRVSEADASLRWLPCSTLSITSDERVVNFARAMIETRPKTPREQNDFHAELITSAANLFIRTVADVQAMFNIYFANDPDWDDDCLSLEPSFPIFYEFATNGLKRRLRTQEKPSSEWMTHRVKVRGTAGTKGNIMKDKNNPWCKHSWGSGDKHPSQRLQFSRPDPPTGLTGHRTPPRQLNGTMMPHLWCELAQGLRNSPEGKTRPYGAVKYQRGKTLSFQAACSQLAFFEVVDSDGDVDGEFKFWRRYDCEQIVLNSAFLTFFPTFVQKVEAAQKKIGVILEDALQCAGRIDDDGREFEAGTTGLHRLCPVSVDEMLERRKEPAEAKKKRSELIASKAQMAIDILKEWMQELGDMEPVFLKDFIETWEVGDKLTGLAYKAGDALQHAYEALGSQKAIAERIESLEEHLVQKAWRGRGQSDKALFPPPVSYETTTTVGVSGNVGATRDVCKIKAVPGLELAGRHLRMGITYIPTALDLEKFCMVGKFAPVPSVEISILGCTRTVEIDEETQKEISWSIGLRGILAVYDMLANSTNMRDAFTRNISRLNTNLMKQDNVTTSVPWMVMKDVLANPLAFLSGSLGSVANAMKPAVMAVGKKLGLDAARAKAKELGGQIKGLVKERLLSKFGGFELKSYRMIEAQLEFVKLGDGPYEPKFSVHYKHLMNAKVSFAFPGAVSGKSNIHLSQRYDLSEVFSVVYHILRGSKDKTIFEKCVQCLGDHHMAFCYKSGSGASRCARKTGHNTCRRLGEEEVIDVTDCSLTDSDSRT